MRRWVGGRRGGKGGGVGREGWGEWVGRMKNLPGEDTR